MLLTMQKNKEIKFSINRDASYRIWLGNRWSVTYPDFAEKYIQLREAGFEERKPEQKGDCQFCLKELGYPLCGCCSCS